MRTYLYLIAAVVSATTLAVPSLAIAAPAAAHPDVLTLGKVGGPDVKVGAVLTTSLEKGGSAVFSLGNTTITCKSNSFTSVVKKNPHAPGKSIEAVTAASIGKCTASVAGLTVKSLKALNLPYQSSFSSAKGFPIVVTGQTKSKPIEVTTTVDFSGSTFSCTYQASAIHGSFSNNGSIVTISKQGFTKVSGSSLCPTKATYTARRLTKQQKRGRVPVCGNSGVKSLPLSARRAGSDIGC
jgi:hypothetical protein